jgi:hypothetical protein
VKRWNRLPLLLLILWTATSFGETAKVSEYGYPWARNNHDLCEELIQQTDRKVPISDWFCAAGDGDVYLRTLGSEEFYHGIGHWVQLRAQVQASEHVAINLRSLLYSGSISYGYTRPLGFYNLLGFSSRWPEEFFGGTLQARAMDLGRQTIATGLLLQERETAGIALDWQRGDFEIKVLGDGTGGLLLADDLKNYELNWLNGALGIGFIEWTEGNRGNPPFRHPAKYVYSDYAWTDTWSTAFEVNARNDAVAALARITAHFKFEIGNLLVRLEGRDLQNGWGDQFVQRIEHMYTSYDQYDKRVMNTSNILTVDDDAQAASLDINLAFKIGDHYEAQFLNEGTSFKFANAPTMNLFFYRWGLAYVPKVDQSEALILFLSNKVLTDSLSLPPFLDSSQNVVMFKSVPFFGIEARFRF